MGKNQTPSPQPKNQKTKPLPPEPKKESTKFLEKQLEKQLKEILEMDYPLKVEYFEGIGVDEEKDALYGEFVAADPVNKAYTFYVQGDTGRPYLQRKS